MTSLGGSSPARSSAIERELAAVLGSAAVRPGDAVGYGRDATETRGLGGQACAVALPSSTEEVARVVTWCCAHGVPIIPQGGATGFAGGVVPLQDSVILSLERLDRVRAFEPQFWRMHVDAGVSTGRVHRLSRESGLAFPPDPGAAEQSQIGGNIATNAGGPHAFKYGTTGRWVTGVEAVVPPGEVITVGGAIRKDVAGYDLKSVLIGSEGTLGVITAAWLTLIPAPEASLPVVAFYADAADGCTAIRSVVAAGLRVAALEYLDAGTLAASGDAYPGMVPAASGFLVMAEADGTLAAARALRDELVAVLGEGALDVQTREGRRELADLWRWRDGVSIAVSAQRGGKVSEDIVVPLDRLEEAIEQTVAIGRRHDLPACSWGHAGDGNLHSTFLIAPGDPEQLGRAERAARELFGLAIDLGGSVSGEHGVGTVKNGQLARQWSPAAVGLHAAIKRTFDPSNLMNPGKKIGAPISESEQMR